MGKAAVWLDMVGSTTVNTTVAKDTSLKSASNEQVRVSVCLTEKADGTKMKPFVFFQGAN